MIVCCLITIWEGSGNSLKRKKRKTKLADYRGLRKHLKATPALATTAKVQCTLATMEDEQNGKYVTQELNNRLEELKCSNAALLAEIDMFERFIGRMDPQDLGSHAGEDGPGTAGGASQLEGGASLKEAEVRLAEIRKAKNEFERRLLKPMKDNRLEMKEPEKVLQYIEDKSKVSQLEKFTLKNQALKAHEKKLQQQLQQKKEMGKAEYEDIFQEYSEHRMEKNLDELQVNNLKVQRVLSSHKEKLQRVTLESTQLSNDITNRKQILAKIEEELQHAEEERLKAEALNQHLRRQMTGYQAPDITEYMHVKARHKKLQQSIHTWERKVGIAEMALKTHTKARSAQRATLTPAYRSEAGARSGGSQIPVKLPHIAEHRT
ncbi:hypothetical protein FQN60_014555 [Etheostoma spectabile]|uniref:Cilia- and flagella-associated protein 263 n=1 Tax=Etheostoma spectabile TaxID=54343 RepID=A0A5J5DDN9_9PERO|nr:hypothetical protein FQN60_014555 [Etheostoma spectabile]